MGDRHKGTMAANVQYQHPQSGVYGNTSSMQTTAGIVRQATRTVNNDTGTTHPSTGTMHILQVNTGTNQSNVLSSHNHRQTASQHQQQATSAQFIQLPTTSAQTVQFATTAAPITDHQQHQQQSYTAQPIHLNANTLAQLMNAQSAQQQTLMINGQQCVVLQPADLASTSGGANLSTPLHLAAGQCITLPVSALQSLQGPSSTQLTSSGGGIHRAIAPIPAPPSPDEPPMYVNAKQYARIVKRREWRARMEQEGRLPKGRSKYMHESRHKHALARQRLSGGRFGPGKAVPQDGDDDEGDDGDSHFRESTHDQSQLQYSSPDEIIATSDKTVTTAATSVSS